MQRELGPGLRAYTAARDLLAGERAHGLGWLSTELAALAAESADLLKRSADASSELRTAVGDAQRELNTLQSRIAAEALAVGQLRTAAKEAAAAADPWGPQLTALRTALREDVEGFKATVRELKGALLSRRNFPEPAALRAPSAAAAVGIGGWSTDSQSDDDGGAAAAAAHYA